VTVPGDVRPEAPETVFVMKGLNWLLFAIGMTGLWLTTHSWVALLWCLVASIHVTVRLKAPAQS